MGIAIVSGAGRGIGAATARELGRRGHHVVVKYLRDATAAAAVVADDEPVGDHGPGDPGGRLRRSRRHRTRRHRRRPARP
ncbi:MAG: SDR family NAD(P)-dependent oxidoreductase, partial [Umezawaea sp.]